MLAEPRGEVLVAEGCRGGDGRSMGPATGGAHSMRAVALRLAALMLSAALALVDSGSVLAAAADANDSATTAGTGVASDEKPDAVAPTRALTDYLKGETPYHVPPGENDIPNDKYGDDVRRGMQIFVETYRYARRYSGNALACSNCHLNAGGKPNAAPLWAAYGMYPAYRAKNDRNNTLEDRIQQCFRFSMNGFSPALDAPEMRALVSYIHFLSRGVPVGVEMPGRGYPQIVNTGYDPNPNRGELKYQSQCAACHGADGHGVKNDRGGYQFPPLWGMDSYNKGAGMARNEILAGFLKANMPLGQDWSLSDQEALDLAAYINLQIRPRDPRKGLLEGLLE